MVVLITALLVLGVPAGRAPVWDPNEAHYMLGAPAPCEPRGRFLHGEIAPASLVRVDYFATVSRTPEAASFRLAPWVVLVSSITTPFWFFMIAAPAPPATVAPAPPTA